MELDNKTYRGTCRTNNWIVSSTLALIILLSLLSSVYISYSNYSLHYETPSQEGTVSMPTLNRNTRRLVLLQSWGERHWSTGTANDMTKWKDLKNPTQNYWEFAMFSLIDTWKSSVQNFPRRRHHMYYFVRTLNRLNRPSRYVVSIVVLVYQLVCSNVWITIHHWSNIIIIMIVSSICCGQCSIAASNHSMI